MDVDIILSETILKLARTKNKPKGYNNCQTYSHLNIYSFKKAKHVWQHHSQKCTSCSKSGAGFLPCCRQADIRMCTESNNYYTITYIYLAYPWCVIDLIIMLNVDAT